jgi:hypothetical protein
MALLLLSACTPAASAPAYDPTAAALNAPAPPPDVTMPALFVPSDGPITVTLADAELTEHGQEITLRVTNHTETPIIVRNADVVFVTDAGTNLQAATDLVLVADPGQYADLWFVLEDGNSARLDYAVVTIAPLAPIVVPLQR